MKTNSNNSYFLSATKIMSSAHILHFYSHKFKTNTVRKWFIIFQTFIKTVPVCKYMNMSFKSTFSLITSKNKKYNQYLTAFYLSTFISVLKCCLSICIKFFNMYVYIWGYFQYHLNKKINTQHQQSVYNARILNIHTLKVSDFTLHTTAFIPIKQLYTYIYTHTNILALIEGK